MEMNGLDVSHLKKDVVAGDSGIIIAQH
jgi:hypothetical protein